MSVNLQKAEFVRSAAKAGDFPRDRLPQVAFAGRSNVGKSSVINRLLNRKNFARVGAAPGKTTHINYFLIDGAFYLVDLPGYGYAKVSQAEKARWGRRRPATPFGMTRSRPLSPAPGAGKYPPSDSEELT